MCINPFWNWFWLFLFLLSLSCNKSNSFLISSISFCMLFYCKFGIFILYLKKKKKFNWGGKFFYNFFHYKNSIYFLDGSCNNSIYSLDGCSWPLVSTKLLCEKPDAWAFILFIYLFFECSGIQVFNLLTCELRDTMPCHWSLILLPRNRRIFIGVAIILSICLHSHVNTAKVVLVVKTLIKNIEQQPN